MKRIVAAFAIMLALTISVAPGFALAADGAGGDVRAGSPVLATQDATSYDVWVGGVEVTSANAASVTGSGIAGKVSYDAKTNTLTLNGATISGTYEKDGYYYAHGDPVPYLYETSYGIYQSGSNALTVKLIGANKLNFNYVGKSDSDGYAIGKQDGKLVFSGSGSLTITSKCQCYSKGIYCADLQVNTGATVKSSISVTDDVCYAVYADDSILAGGTLSARAVNTGSSDTANGVYTENLLVKKGGKLTASAQGSSYAWSISQAVKVNGKLTVAGALSASSKGNIPYGLSVNEGGSVAKGGKLTVTTETAFRDAAAIELDTENFAVNGTAKVTSNTKGIVSSDSDSKATVTVGSTGELITSGSPAIESIDIKLSSSALKVLAGSSSSTARTVPVSKIGDARYVRICAPKVNPITAKAKAVAFKFAKVKTKSRYVKAAKAFVVKNAKGKVTYKVFRYLTKAAKGKVKVASNGKVTVKKGTPKKTYKLRVKITAAGNSEYKPKAQFVTLVVKVK